jgi:hypothetical protein
MRRLSSRNFAAALKVRISVTSRRPAFVLLGGLDPSRMDKSVSDFRRAQLVRNIPGAPV